MKRDVAILREDEIHKGYFSVNRYEIKASNLDPNKEPLHFNREVMISKDSVMVLIYAPSLDSFVFCQQFRPGIFLNANGDQPYELECVAGTIDKENTPEEIAKMEVWEEAGIQIDHLQKIAVAYKSPGLMTEKMHFFYAETQNSPKSGFYGIETEDIKTHIITREETYALMDGCRIIDLGTLFALNWFRANK